MEKEMGSHSKEDNDKMTEHVAQVMQQFTSNMAKDKLCYTCGLELIAVTAMMNHFMQAIMEKPVPSVTPLDLAAYADYITGKLFEFVVAMEQEQETVKLYRFDPDGDLIPEKKNMS